MNYSKGGKKLTQIEWEEKALNYNLTTIGVYKNSKTPIKHKCNKCGMFYKIKPKQISQFECKRCVRINEYKNKIKEMSVKLIGTYVNQYTKTKHKCSTCDNIWETTPKTVLNSLYGCPSCSGKKFSTDDYKSKLPSNLILLGEYRGTTNKSKHKCLDCDYVWETKPNYILHMNTNCPMCKSSKGERKISEYLKVCDVFFNKEFIIDDYRYDFYLPKYNLLIEYDGIQHYQPVHIFGGYDEYINIKKRDKLKNKLAIKHGYNLIRIPYKDFNNIEEIIGNHLRIEL